MCIRKMIVIVNALFAVDKLNFAHSVNDLGLLEHAGKTLWLSLTNRGQKFSKSRQGFFCTNSSVDIQRVFHSLRQKMVYKACFLHSKTILQRSFGGLADLVPGRDRVVPVCLGGLSRLEGLDAKSGQTTISGAGRYACSPAASFFCRQTSGVRVAENYVIKVNI